jgi:energy-coupling factor transport system ATP-binding protein
MLFQLNDVSYTYQHGTPFARKALHNLSLDIAAGKTTALVGATLSGKSTIIDLLAGLIKPTHNSVLFEGDDIAASGFDIERIRARVGVVFQSPEAQIFEETVGKDVSFGPRRRKLPLAESRRLVQESLEAVGLSYEDFRTRYTYALSGGQKRRVAIAGVLAMQPEVILLDEPTAGLDPRGRRELLDLMHRLKQRTFSSPGKPSYPMTIVYASNSLQEVIELADTIYILDQGRTLMHGTPREILARAPELLALDIALPEVTEIALALRDVFPTLPTTMMSLAELEEVIVENVVEVKR